jgi:serine/threonine protein kinase/tetratricopeptide (TPR) repeat protein
MAERGHEHDGDRLNTNRKSGHGDERAVETTVDPSQARDSAITQDPLEELDPAGRAMLEQVRIGLGLVPGSPHRMLGRYVLGRCLGSGGMGVVHLAEDPQLGREVAIKRIAPRPYVSSKVLRTRLEREGRALAKLRHPNVIHIYELGEHEGEVFLAMEYVAGQTLSEWQRQPGRSRNEILWAYIEAGKGIAAAHAAEVVHRDFKPENVLVADDGRVQVGDFGLAALLRELELPEGAASDTTLPSEAARLTKTGELLGTLPYMAPERLRGESGDARSDQFSFCVALWEALTGQLPFAGEEQVALRERILAGELREGAELRRWLRLTLERGLAAQPEQRHPNMASVVAALERGLGRPKRWLLGGTLSVTGVIAVLSVGFVLVNRSAEKPCALQETLAATPEPEMWEPLRQELGVDAVRLEPLEHHWRLLAAQAEWICQADDADAYRSHAVAWLEDLQRLLARSSPGSDERVLDYIDWLADRRLHGPPPKPLGEGVAQALDASEALELANDLDGAFEQAELALASSTETFERADALLRRGRVQSLRREYDKALVDFHEARGAADRGKYDDARFRANLLAAELVLKRFDTIEEATHYLDDGEAVAFRIHESILSPRRASQDELRAIVERIQKRTAVALLLQLRALLRRSLAGDPPHLLARNLAGAGVIAEARGEPELAERCYRTALAKLPGPSPDRYQVAYLLGRWLSNQVLADAEADPEEARALLREAIEGRPELGLQATSSLLLMELYLDARSPTVASLAEQLARSLQEQGETGKRAHRSEGWQTLGLAYAVANELAGLERAAREVYRLTPTDEPLTLAEFELTIADFAVDEETRRRYAGLARSRLEQMPSSEQREQMLTAAAELLSDAP